MLAKTLRTHCSRRNLQVRAKMDQGTDQPRELKRLAVFCGASKGTKPEYMASAKALGQQLVKENIGLVYGGGTVGLMGEVARTVCEGSGPSAVYGVIPRALAPRELSGEMIGHCEVVEDMHTRKALMARHADGFIGLPGGFGTMEELLEVITWQQLGFHAKPIALLNIDGFYDTLLTFFSQCTEAGFVKEQHSRSILVSADPAELISMMRSWKAPPSAIAMAQMSSQSSQAIGLDVSRPSGNGAQ